MTVETTLDQMGRFLSIIATQSDKEILSFRREQTKDPLVALIRDKNKGELAYYKISKNGRLQRLRSF